MTTELAITELEPAILEINEDTPVEQIAEMYSKLDGMVRRAKKLMELWEERMESVLKSGQVKTIEWKIDAEGNVLKFWMGHPKSIKVVSIDDVLTWFFTESSIEELSSCLSVNCFKHGAVRKILERYGKPELFDKFFETIIKDKLENNEPKPRELQKLNTAFLT